MIFILLGIVLLSMKLVDIHPVAGWEWHFFAVPFIAAIVWFEFLEPMLGLDVKRQLNKKRQFEARVHGAQNKKPRR
ncbi:TIGR04438 family Trp-rich protein [Limnobacter parvus]|uniref:TIGR04438 family Trp-rich protein n=1 Tax=Limnobacter parvus TaxID=2939690 RepID=A0ABT1XIX0_9BURK|nr:TIGR04438 family Trp-rich protein [Limnobacter parvus]MCR2746044.1 TIGR04438 family Trp-rich protein [Limnobacter parvus]